MYFARLAAAGKDRVYFFNNTSSIRVAVSSFDFRGICNIWDLVSGFMRMRVYCAGAAPHIELVYSCDLVWTT